MTVPPGASVAVYFVSDSTGITAETLGNALLAHFPGITFHRRIFPFVDTAEAADEVVRQIHSSGTRPLVFMAAKTSDVIAVLTQAPCDVVDLLAEPLTV